MAIIVDFKPWSNRIIGGFGDTNRKLNHSNQQSEPKNPAADFKTLLALEFISDWWVIPAVLTGVLRIWELSW